MFHHYSRKFKPLASAALPTPDLMERRVEPNVDLVLDVEVGDGEQREQLLDVLGHLRPEVGLDEIVPVEALKGGRLGRRLRRRLGSRRWGR